MVMKGVISALPRFRRMGVAQAKARLSEALRDLSAGPVVIHSRGRDVAVLLAIDDFDMLSADRGSRGGAALLERLANLKHGLSGGVDDFEPGKLNLRTRRAFRGSRAAR